MKDIRSYKKRIISIVLVFAFCLTMVACGQVQKKAEKKKDDSLKKVLKSGKLVLGLDRNYPPMGFLADSGKIEGFDIDVAKEVCKRMGVKLKKKSIAWDEKEDELNSGSIDCIWNGLSVTPEREASMSLSEPYMKNERIIIVPGDSDVKAVSDLTGKKVGVQKGSTAQEALERSEFYEEIREELFDDNLMLIAKLKNGELDAIILDSVVAYYCIFNGDETYYVLSDSIEEEEFAIGFRKGDNVLRDKVQDIISDMKADGSLGEISCKWFGSDITIVR